MKKRSTRIVLIVTVICCLAMALIDGVIRPGYAVKSAIKIALFMLIPLIASRLDRSVFYLQVTSPQAERIIAGHCPWCWHLCGDPRRILPGVAVL